MTCGWECEERLFSGSSIKRRLGRGISNADGLKMYSNMNGWARWSIFEKPAVKKGSQLVFRSHSACTFPLSLLPPFFFLRFLCFLRPPSLSLRLKRPTIMRCEAQFNFVLFCFFSGKSFREIPIFCRPVGERGPKERCSRCRRFMKLSAVS